MTARETARVFAAVLRRRSLRRVLLAFFIFNAAEWATWIAMLVYAFTKGGTTAAGLVALIQLVPAALVAPFGSVLGDRMRRDRALAAGYAAQAATMAVTAFALWSEAPLAARLRCRRRSVRARSPSPGPSTTRSCPSSRPRPTSSPPRTQRRARSKGLAIFVGPFANGILIGISGPWLVFAASAGASLVSVLHDASDLQLQVSGATSPGGDARQGRRRGRRRLPAASGRTRSTDPDPVGRCTVRGDRVARRALYGHGDRRAGDG